MSLRLVLCSAALLLVTACKKKMPPPPKPPPQAPLDDAGKLGPDDAVPGEASMNQVFFSHTSEGPRLIAIVSARHPTKYYTQYRFEVIDAATGKRVRQVVLPQNSGQPSCSGALGGRLWCGEYGGLGIHLRDVASLDVVADLDAIAAKNPLLAKGVYQQEPALIHEETRALIVVSNDGVRLSIDPRTLIATETPEETKGQALGGGHRTAVTTVRVKDVSYEVDPGTRRRGLLKGYPAQPVGGETFLRASFVADPVAGGGYLLDSPTSVLVAHQDTLDDSNATRRISRVTLEGQLVWTAEPAKRHFAQGWLTGKTLVLVWIETQAIAVGVDVETGKEIWRTPLY